MDTLFNRTKRYLIPVLNTYPNVFKTELKKRKFNLFVCDTHYYKSKGIDFQNYFFLNFLYDKELIKVCRSLKYFEDEYPVDLVNQYMVVLRIPEEFQNSYEMFLEGKYSKMYPHNQLVKLGVPQIHNGLINLTYCVLAGSKLAYEDYKRIVKEVYKSSHYSDSPSEYDIPPRIRQEVLNSRGNEDYVKSICKLINL